MKKSLKLFISVFFILIISLYLAYMEKPICSTMSEYIEAHLNNPQQYLFIITIYAIFVLWAIFIPYLEPCFYLRSPNLTEQINKRNLFYSLIFGVATFFLYVFSAVLVGYNFELNYGYIVIILKVVLYYFMCFELSTAIYLIFKKMVLSILSLYLINLAIIGVYYSINFYFFLNAIPNNLYKLIFIVYTIFVTISVLLFNEIYIKRKEII